MSSITPAATRTQPDTTASQPIGMTSVINVARAQFVNRWDYLVLPWIILGSTFVINLLVFWLLDSAGVEQTPGEESSFTGGIMSIFVFMLVTGVIAIAQGYRYCLAMSVTRRAFYAGIMGVGVVASVTVSLGLLILGAIENATDGWGLKLMFFTLPWLTDGGPAATGVVWFSISLLMFAIGATFAINYTRWGLTGSWATATFLALIVIGFFALVVFLPDFGSAVWQWLLTQSALSLSLWLLVPSALMVALGWLFIRRAPVR